jgi:hypothetical protein
MMLVSRLDPGTGCGWVSLATVREDAGAGENTVDQAVTWARRSGFLHQAVRGHRLGNGEVVASEWEMRRPNQDVNTPDTGVKSTSQHPRSEVSTPPRARLNTPDTGVPRETSFKRDLKQARRARGSASNNGQGSPEERALAYIEQKTGVDRDDAETILEALRAEADAKGKPIRRPDLYVRGFSAEELTAGLASGQDRQRDVTLGGHSPWVPHTGPGTTLGGYSSWIPND